MSAVLLHAEDLHIGFGGIKAADGVHLEVSYQGEFHVNVPHPAERSADLLVADGGIFVRIASGYQWHEREQFANAAGGDAGVVHGVHVAVVHAGQPSCQERCLLIEQFSWRARTEHRSLSPYLCNI